MPTWKKICEECSVGGAIKVTFTHRHDDDRGGAIVVLTMNVPCVISGEMKEIARQVHVPNIELFNARMDDPAKRMASILLQHAIDLYVHEVKEQFRFRGERPFIPHREH